MHILASIYMCTKCIFNFVGILSQQETEKIIMLLHTCVGKVGNSEQVTKRRMSCTSYNDQCLPFTGLKSCFYHFVFEGGGGPSTDFVTQVEGPPPCPALRGEGEVVNLARRSPGGRRKETTFHF